MKKLVILCSMAAISYSTASFADTKNFEGFAGSLNLGLISSGIKLSGGDAVFDGFGGKSAFSGGIDLGWGTKISDTGVLTVGVEADLIQPDVFNVNAGGGDTLTAKQKHRYGIYVAPGTVIGNDTLVYGKVGYNSMKGELVGAGDFAEFTRSQSFTGFGYGLGIKTMITPQAFLKVEVNRLSYSSEIIGSGTFEPSSTVGVVGIGTSF
jgi:opacity protein-like surface antigen